MLQRVSPYKDYRLIESNAKCRHLKSDLERDFAAGMYLSEASFPPRYCLRVVEQFCRFWIWSDTECETPCRIWPPTWLNTPHFLPATHCLFILYFDRMGGGGAVTREKGRGATGESNSDQKAGSKIPTWLNVHWPSPVFKLCVCWTRENAADLE